MALDLLDARVDEAGTALEGLGLSRPVVGVVLGSGLGGFVDALEPEAIVDFANIPHMPKPRVEGHAGRLCFGRISGLPVVCQSGRVHLYEGHPPEDVVFASRLLARLGCSAVMLTNAAGGISASLRAGDLMLVVDHINLTGHNPLLGHPAFIDMTDTYDTALASLARTAARDGGVDLFEGVYAGMLGPSYETPAEVRMLATMGASAVGMSTVLEAIALRHAAVRVGAVSCITNPAAGLAGRALDHAEVTEVANRTAGRLCALLRRWIELYAEGSV